MTFAAAAAAAVAQARNRVLAALEAAGSPEAAVAYDPPRSMEQRQLQRLVTDGVVREASPGRYWLDRERLAAAQAGRRRTALIMLVVVMVIGMAAVALTLLTTR